MSLEERTYSVLVVSASARFHENLSPFLPASRYTPIVFTASISAAKRTLAERAFDFVLINAPLPDDIGTRFAIDTCKKQDTVVLLFASAELHGDLYNSVAEHGVFTLPKPTSRSLIVAALSWMISARERLRRAETKTLSMEERMEEIRLINRAKWFLVSEQGMSEPEAHHYIEKQAMNQCISKRAVAEGLLNLYSPS